MATYRITGTVTQDGTPVASALVVVISRTSFTHLGHGEVNPEDGSYRINIYDHPDPVIVICFHSAYNTEVGVEPYFSLGALSREAEIHDNITPIELPQS